MFSVLIQVLNVFAQNKIVSAPSGVLKKCGSDIAACPTGYCCGPTNSCGTGPAYCGIDCQADYGDCFEYSRTICGPAFSNRICSEQLKCSQHGFCGVGPDHAGIGCQQDYSMGSCSDLSVPGANVTLSSRITSTTFSSSPTPVVQSTNGRLTWYKFFGVGGYCDGKARMDSELVCAMHTHILQCSRTIRIRAPSGTTVDCFVVDMCNVNDGCVSGTIDGTPGVWNALGLDLSIGVVPITWYFV